MTNDKLNCMVGDFVDFDENEKVITNVEKRKNYLHRPLIANIDYVTFVYSISSPNFDIINFQKLLLNANVEEIPSILLLNKIDLVSKEELNTFSEHFSKTFKDVILIPVSVLNNEGLDQFRKYLLGKSIVLSGPSGSGKSSLINKILNNDTARTGDISTKTERGKHTTRDTHFYPIGTDSFLIDTPGFSSIDVVINLENKKSLELYFPEFQNYLGQCKYSDCLHINEPKCVIKENVESGNIPLERYKFYLFSINNMK